MIEQTKPELLQEEFKTETTKRREALYEILKNEGWHKYSSYELGKMFKVVHTTIMIDKLALAKLYPPKGAEEVKQIAEKHFDDSLKTLEEIIETGNKRERTEAIQTRDKILRSWYNLLGLSKDINLTQNNIQVNAIVNQVQAVLKDIETMPLRESHEKATESKKKVEIDEQETEVIVEQN